MRRLAPVAVRQSAKPSGAHCGGQHVASPTHQAMQDLAKHTLYGIFSSINRRKILT